MDVILSYVKEDQTMIFGDLTSNRDQIEPIKESAILEGYPFDPNSEKLQKYMVNGDPAYAKLEYSYYSNAYPDKISPYYVPSFNIPSNIDLKVLEDEMAKRGKKIHSQLNKAAYINGDYPFKFYQTVNFNKQYLNMMDNLMKSLSFKDRFSFRTYQHNFMRDNHRYSMLIAATKNEILGVYYLYKHAPTEIPVKRLKLMKESAILEYGFDQEAHGKYCVDGNREYAEKWYKEFGHNTTKVSPYYVPTFDIPSNINLTVIEDEMEKRGKKIRSLMNQINYINGDYPFKFYQTVEFNNEYLNMMDNLMLKLPFKDRFGFKVYQYNFSKNTCRYSVLIVATKSEVLAVYYLYGRVPNEIPIKRLKLMKESTILEADDDFEEPDAESNDLINVKDLLDNTDPKRIFMSSDWHFFKNHYKKEHNYVNTQKIVTWCKQNIKDDDVFMYLGDISFRYANAKDKAESQKIMASLPGHKILILGNHDIMAGADYYSGCGFEYVFESLEWNNIVFTHKPVAMEAYPDPTTLNIHGHIHTNKEYNTTDGKRNINVYPYFYDNKPVTLDYCLKHKDVLVKDNYRSDWTNMGESYDNSLSGVRELIYENAQTENASSVLFSPDINANTIAYMVSAYKDRLPGNVAIKLHVGEEGNENYLSPRLVSSLAKTFRATLVDSTVAYKSTKQTVEGHMKMAEDHGFTKVANFDVLDAEGGMELAIPADNRIKKALAAGPNNELGIPDMSKGPHLESIEVGEHLNRYDSMIVFSHFKGHSMAGFGGAIKNIGMGIPTGKKGKLQIHGEGEWQWGPDFLERLAESASAIQDYFDGNMVFVNVLANISSKCDCEADAPKSKMPNIGVLVSSDPIALEQASLDFVRNCKGNKDVMDMISSRGGVHQVEYGEWLGMGTRKYKLYDLNKNRLKLESTYISEMKRSKLPDSSFGIPEDRKYPLDSKQHVQSAIKLFGHAEESKKKALAHRIKTAADKYDIKIPETTQCYKYLNESADYLISDKIKNIVFDLGSVIVDANTMDVILDSSDIPKEHAKEIYDLVTKKMLYEKDEHATNFLHTCSIEQAMEFFKNVAPKHLKMYVKPVFKLFSKAMYQMDYVDDLISTLRAKGYSIYYLSNWDKYTYELEENFFKGILNKFDGGLFSFEVAKQKPDPEIYKIFLNKFGLEASECIFYDDKPENVEAAKSVGMDAVIFDKETTPYELIGCYDIDFSDLENTFIAGGDEVKPFDIRQLNKWHISSSRHPYSISPDGYYPSIEDAIQHCIIDNDFINGPIQRFVFTCNDDDSSEFNRMIPIGNILVSPDRTYKWQIQYPLNIKNGKLTSCIEWAMAACNPIQGIAKPFILKTGSDCDTLDTAEFAFSPDIISDKYLVVNENAQLQIVDSSYFDGRLVEEYEYVGNRFNIRKIAEAYKSKAIVDTTYFYTALTGKPMLTEDQIDFDKCFKKVDFELMKETALSTAATRRDEIIEAMGYKTSKLPIEESFILENVPFMRRYNKNERTFIIKEDFDGYYFFNLLNHKRTASVVSSNLLTETMIKSIL